MMAFADLFQPYPLSAAEPSSRSREIDELIREAEVAGKRLDVDRARELWAQVYGLEPSTMALCQLGQLDRRLGRLEEAATELTKCVEQMPPPTNAIERRRYEVRHADLAAVRQRVAKLHVLVPPGTARVLVDGREVNAGGSSYVAPGQHEVTATGRQGQIAHALVKVAVGESRGVQLTFEPHPATPAVKAPAPARVRPKPWIVGTGAAVSVTLLVTGLGLHRTANNADNESAAKAFRLSNDPMLPSNPQFKRLYAEATDAHVRASLMHGFGSAALIAGAAVGAATLVYVGLPGNTELRARAAGAEVKLAW